MGSSRLLIVSSPYVLLFDECYLVVNERPTIPFSTGFFLGFVALQKILFTK